MIFCFSIILQIWIISIGFRDTDDFVNYGICRHEFIFTCRSYSRLVPFTNLITAFPDDLLLSPLNQECFYGNEFCVSTCFNCALTFISFLHKADEFQYILKADFLSSQKPLAASFQVLAGSRNHFLSFYEYYNLLNIGPAGL